MPIFSSLRHLSSWGLLFSAFPATLQRVPGSCCPWRVIINHTPFPYGFGTNFSDVGIRQMKIKISALFLVRLGKRM